MADRGAPLVLHRSGPEIRADRRQQSLLQAAWRERHYLSLPGFLDAEVLAAARAAVRDATAFRPQRWQAGDEHLLPDSAAGRLLNFLLNDAVLLQAIAGITGRTDVTGFNGRIYRLTPGTGESHGWHTDVMHGRRAALSINLSDQPFEGGQLQLRDAATGRLLAELANHGEGDAVLFRVDEDLEHRVRPVGGAVARTAFAGWFTTGPGLAEQLYAMAPDAGPK